MAYTAILHYATVEYGSGSYSEVTVANVAALTGYGSMNLSILGVSETPEIEGAIAYADGSMMPSRSVRYAYPIQLTPSPFASDRDAVTNDVVTIAKKYYCWLELNTYAQDSSVNVGVTTNYHATDYCIPVTLDGVDVEHNYSTGYKRATLNFVRRFRS